MSEQLKCEVSDESEVESTESSSSEEIIEGSEAFDKNYLLLLSYLKSNDSTMYDKDHKFFKDSDYTIRKKSKKKKPFLKKDYERQIILEKNENFESDYETAAIDETDGHCSGRAFQKTTSAENSKLIEAIKQKADVDTGDDELFVLKKEHEPEKTNTTDEADYIRYVKGELDELSDRDLEKKLKPLRDFWNDPNLDPNEKILRDFILNNKSYGLESEDNESAVTDESEDRKLEEFEQFEEMSDKFQSDFNRRHATSNNDFQKKYSQLVEGSVRKRKTTRRSEQRKRRKERKREEKNREVQEKKRIKNSLRKTVSQQLEQLKKLTGRSDLTIENFEVDFDPEKFDEEKPNQTNGQNKSSQILEISRDLKKLIRELHNSGCEDFIRKIPLPPNDYGLTTEEILMADDKDLERWYPMKEMTKIRSDEEKRRINEIYQKRGKNKKLKRKLMPSLYKHELKNDEDADDQEQVTRTEASETNRIGKKRKRSKNESSSDDKTNAPKKKPRSKFNSEKELGMKISDSRLEAFGLNPNKLRRQKNYEKKVRPKK